MKGMQEQIETHPDIAKSIDDDLIMLLQEIQKLMHETVRTQYSLLTIHHAIRALITIKQKDGKELLEFFKRFKQTCSTYKNYMGVAWFDAHIDTTAEYLAAIDNAGHKAIKDKVFKAYIGAHDPAFRITRRVQLCDEATDDAVFYGDQSVTTDPDCHS